MTRTLSSAVDATVTNNAAGTEVLNWVAMLEVGLDSGTVYMHTGIGDLVWNSHTWLGVGGIGSLSGVPENTALGKGQITANLSHIPIATLPDFITEFTTNDPVGRPWVTYLDVLNTDATIKDVVTLDSGFIGSPEIGENADAGNLSLKLLNESTRLGLSTFYRMTDQGQQSIWSGDDFFKYVTDTNLAEISWGHTSTRVAGGSGSIPFAREHLK